MLSSEFCEISANTFSYRTRPVAACDFRNDKKDIPINAFKTKSSFNPTIKDATTENFSAD